MTIKAIETRYKGHRFRSRLEARWAVFFDYLGIQWKYETQGYHIKNNRGRKWTYLPDFYLPVEQCWVEVKGDMDRFDSEMFVEIFQNGGQLPSVFDSIETTRGILVLSDIPQPTPIHPSGFCLSQVISHPILQCNTEGDIIVGSAFFGAEKRDSSIRSDFGESFNPVEFDSSMKRTQISFVTDGLSPREWECERFEHGFKMTVGQCSDNDQIGNLWWYGIQLSPRILYECARNQMHAYAAARSARFEHGECG